MSIYTYAIKDRTKLEEDIAAFIKSGGKVEEVPSSESRLSKIELVRRNLFHQIHHGLHAKNLGIPHLEIRRYSRQPHQINDELLEKMWVYFRERESERIIERWVDKI